MLLSPHASTSRISGACRQGGQELRGTSETTPQSSQGLLESGEEEGDEAELAVIDDALLSKGWTKGDIVSKMISRSHHRLRYTIEREIGLNVRFWWRKPSYSEGTSPLRLSVPVYSFDAYSEAAGGRDRHDSRLPGERSRFFESSQNRFQRANTDS